MQNISSSNNSTNNIIVICREPPFRLPPVLNTLLILKKYINTVYLLTTSFKGEARDELENIGINVIEVLPAMKSHKFAFLRLFSWLNFRNAVKKELNKLPADLPLWIGSADTVLALGSLVLRYSFTLHLHELYDQYPIHRLALRKYIKKANAIVVPEPCRAAIIRCWYHLSSTPFVLPNKPYLNINKYSILDLDDDTRRKLDAVAGKKMILYQARSMAVNFMDIAHAVNILGSNFVFALLGDIPDIISFNKVNKICPGIIHFKYIPAPIHLSVTKHAYIGVLRYHYKSLNHIFCAPNKTWEYSGLGKPMICNHLPMLSTTLNLYKAGESFEAENINSIVTAINKIDSDYQNYVNGCTNLYQSVNNEATICDIIEKIK